MYLLRCLCLWTLLFLVLSDTEYLTTNSGAPVDDGKNSLTAGRRGPTLLQDQLLVEKLQVHNRERIPERNVHARGATAKGYFVVTQDVSNYTFAEFLNQVGKKTPIACRWSTVIHGRDSPEFLRDPRGFAVKFYTEKGNYDVVGLNFPVFFIRDGIRFPEMIRSLKPNPKTGVQEWWRIWDYFSNYPESTHMFTWLMDDVGIPYSYRHLDGWGVHTYKWINKIGKETWVRYYYASEQGVRSLNDSDAILNNFSFHTSDLYQAIQNGQYPKWKVYIQTLDPTDTNKINGLTFDPIDTTKAWPADQFPFQEIGEFVFNENVNSQFLENEQIAFSPGRFVPGIEPSDDKMLQARVFAYADTQTYRLGVNNLLLPINKPKCPYFDNHIDGYMNFEEDGQSANEINYYPSRIRDVQPAPGYPHDPETLYGKKVRQNIGKEDNFEQGGNRYRSFDSPRRLRLAQRIAATYIGDRMNPEVLSTWLSYWQQVDSNLASDIKKYIKVFRGSFSSENGEKNVSERDLRDLEIMKKVVKDFHRAAGSSP